MNQVPQWLYWIGSITIAFAAFYFGRKDKSMNKAEKDTTLSVNVQYIKESVDRMALEQKDTNKKLDKQGEDFVKMQIEQAKMWQQIKVLNNAVFSKKEVLDE